MMKNKKAYNNGVKVIYLTEQDTIPDGFVRGGLCTKSPEQIKKDALKSAETQKRHWNEKTNEEKQEYVTNRKNHSGQMSDDAKALKTARYLATMQSKSPDELAQIAVARSKGNKDAWARMSPERKTQVIQNGLKHGAGWNFETIKDTIQSKYGVDNISQLEEIKQKKSISIQATANEKWGCNHPFQSAEVRELIKKKMTELYGYANPGSVPEIQQKIKDTNLSKYGKPYGFNFDKIHQTCLEKYGVEYSCLTPQCINSIGAKSSHTKPNEEFAELLLQNDIKFDREFPISNRLFDFKINDTLIEIDPFATHNSTWGLFNGCGIDKNYHSAKSKLARDSGYKCIHIFDWDDRDKIIALFKERPRIYARNCVVQEITESDAKTYIDTYHLQGYARATIFIGLFYNNELVSIMTFDKARYNKKYQYELVRYCANYMVIGGAEKLFKYFIETRQPTSILSYCDYSKFTGNTYNHLGMKLIKVSISRHWYNPKTKQHILDSLLNKLGYDKIFHTNYGKGTSNKELMLQSGFVEIYDAGQAQYIWEND